MDVLNRVVVQNLGLVVVVLAALLLLLMILVVVLAARVGRATRGYRELVRGTDGGTLEAVLNAHIERVEAVTREMTELRRHYQELAQRTQGTLQHVGMVRYNPFEDTGSDQSFVIALLDDRRDGVVITGLHSRDGTRVFAKPVEGGASRHSLSPEESQAIQIAVEGTQALSIAR